jgi:hypothetical protein
MLIEQLIEAPLTRHERKSHAVSPRLASEV